MSSDKWCLSQLFTFLRSFVFVLFRSFVHFPCDKAHEEKKNRNERRHCPVLRVVLKTSDSSIHMRGRGKSNTTDPSSVRRLPPLDNKNVRRCVYVRTTAELALSTCQINRVDERQYVAANHETLLSNKYLIGPFLIEYDGVNELEYSIESVLLKQMDEALAKRKRKGWQERKSSNSLSILSKIHKLNNGINSSKAIATRCVCLNATLIKTKHKRKFI